ncbi:uncharacterized protein BX664DRAFT_323438 [Halteromyces radiatus]|uniref:uncharacterized protein n=1 Tax=Halteromyces radiatus TaxID=101107 RepID=UPI00221ECC66|nr:uncharacterized protein BX664DRAFT_323438 [Halteromyces radiatus]KAI8096238.1 hypothetical protein BX664DRAFT_323438 [Halteromyces radiatus]
MNGFKDVSIKTFELPSDNPNGGIDVKLGTVLVSPSPVGVQMGTIEMDMAYQGVNLGRVRAENVTLKQGPNEIPLTGVLIPQTDPAALEKVGNMFTTYVSGAVAQTSATGVSAAPNGKDSVDWLTNAFKTVQLNVGLSNAGGPLKMINAVNMGYLDLAFNANAPYAPVLSAPSIVADFHIPFGFSLDIYEVTQNITMNSTSGGNFSELIVPWVPSQSNQATGKLQFAVSNSPITALPGKDSAFDDYTFDLTASDSYTFGVTGLATTKTKTPIGNITLGGVTFSVPTSLHGLQFLNSTPTVINSVDMTGGTQQALQLDIGVTMGNPSDFSMSVGDVTFAMFAGSTQVGTVTLANLTLQRGDNTVVAKANFDPKSSQDGQGMLTAFVMGKNSSASIGGFQQSTAIQSLVKALSAIKIDTTLPGLKSPLIQSAALTVLPDTIQTSIVNVAVSIANPFTAGLAITKVRSAATYKGMPVGNIDQDISNNPFVIGGHATASSPQLNMQMNLEPAAVALLMRDLAVDAHLDTKPLDGLLGMGGFHIQGQENVDPTAALFKGFNISSFVMQAMTALKTDLNLESTLQVGEYTDDLSFSQNGVQITSDGTVTRLIPVVGQPIVQQIVNGAILGFDNLILSDPTNNNAKVQMKGSITKTGPMDATISFPTPLTIRWQGKTLGTATMPPVQAIADQGAQFDVPSNFVITDQDAMQAFAAYMINNEEFVWDIVSNDVSVTALGFTFTGIKMEKFVTLKGANGFKGAVTINSFDLPSNDPAGGITLTCNTTIVNPSQVGFSLNSVSFNSFFDDVLIGPLAAAPGNFAPSGSSSIQMKGRMVPQNSQQGLDAVTTVFENYLNANDSLLVVQGDAASGPAGQVGWLTSAFKTLKIENVVLPGPKVKPNLIPSITMMNMQLDFTKDPYSPSTSSTNVQAQLKNPFGFPLGVSQLNMEADASFSNQKMAHLSVPDEKATTNSGEVVQTQFSDLPFKIESGAHELYSTFLTGLTKSANASFGLSGTTNAISTTAVGNLNLKGIGFDVVTSLAGFANFDGKTDILSLAVSGGTKDYTIVSTVIGFNNPSQITITVGDINFSSKMSDGSVVGQVFVKSAVIKPGANQFDAEFHLAGDTKAIGQLFSDYLTKAVVPLTIFGTSTSTTIEPLKEAFQTVNLATTMTGIQSNLVAGVKVSVTIGDLVTKKAQTVVTLQNPLKTSYTLTALKADVFFPGKSGNFKVGHIDSIPGPCAVPAGGSTTCDQWEVSMDANIAQLLEVVTASDKSMDLQQNLTTTIGGSDGYVSSFYYYQDKVPTEMDVDLGIFNLPLGPKVNTTANPLESMPGGSVLSSATSSLLPSVSDILNLPTGSSGSDKSKPSATPTDTGNDKSNPTTTSDDKSKATPTSNDSKPSSDSSKNDGSSSSSSASHHFIFPF